MRWMQTLSLAIVLGALSSPGLLWAPQALLAQDVPPLRGEVLVGDDPLDSGMVVLHQVTSEEQGEVDSVRVAADGSFTFRLPSPPLGAADRFYFASIRHQGILYFGSALADVAQLDSIYRIQAYDTARVDGGARVLPVLARNLFLEPFGEDWRITDIFQVRNDEGRTLVTGDGGAVWRHPLLPGARDFTSGQDGFSLDGTTLEDGHAVVRAAIAPGDRVFIFRYTVDDPFATIPAPGPTGQLDILVREPSPRVGIEGLELVGRVELEAGSTYRRYSGVDVAPGVAGIVRTQADGELPMGWITVLVGLVMAIAALFATRGLRTQMRAQTAAGGGTVSAFTGPARRQALLLEVARLDEEFEAKEQPSGEERAKYEVRRAALLDELRKGA